MARAGGAQRVWWTRQEPGGAPVVVAVNQFHYQLEAGRVSGDTMVTITFHAAYPDGIRRLEIPVSIHESIADPEFQLTAPTHWDGRSPLTLSPALSVPEAAQIASGASPLKTTWSVEPLATAREIRGHELILKRALHGGRLTVTATLDNGGTPLRRSVTVSVRPPRHDGWVQQAPHPATGPGTTNSTPGMTAIGGPCSRQARSRNPQKRWWCGYSPKTRPERARP